MPLLLQRISKNSKNNDDNHWLEEHSTIFDSMIMLFQRNLSFNPAVRTTIQDISNHPFFQCSMSDQVSYIIIVIIIIYCNTMLL